MIDSATLDRLLQLPPDDRLALVEALWTSLSETPQAVPVPDWHRKIVAGRLDEDDADGEPGEGWAEVRRRIERGG